MGGIVKRGNLGRFAKGTKAGPGMPKGGSRVTKMKAALLDATTIAQAKRIFKVLGEMAEGGSLPAIKLYLRYIAGDPRHTYDPRQGLPADNEQKRQGPQYTPQEQLIIARAMMREAERRLREQEPIEAEGEEVQDGSGD